MEKPTSKFRKLPLAIVTWKDHTSCDDWTDEGDYEYVSKLSTITSVGWIREETDEKIVLVSAVDRDSGGYGQIQTIGKGLLEHIKIIRRSDAIRPSDVEIQKRKASQRQQVGPQGKEQVTSNSNHAQRKAGEQIKA